MLSFDHALIAVPDLTAAEMAWRAAGFTVTSRGRHKGWGTANACIMLADGTYLELLGIRDPAEPLNGLDRQLEKTPKGGAMGWAWSVADAEQGAAHFAASGLPVEERALSRFLDLPEGSVEPSFRLLMPTSRPFGVTAFACRHLTPELIRRPGWENHENGAERLVAFDVPAAPEEAAFGILEALGADPKRDPGGVRFQAGTVQVRIGDDAPSGLTIAVSDLGAVAKGLVDLGGRHRGDSVEVAVTGMVVQFVQG